MGYSEVICPYCVIVIYWKFDYCKIGFYKVYIIAQCKILPVTMTDMNLRFCFASLYILSFLFRQTRLRFSLHQYLYLYVIKLFNCNFIALNCILKVLITFLKFRSLLDLPTKVYTAYHNKVKLTKLYYQRR